MPQDSHIPFYHTTIRRKLQEVFKIFLRKLCGVKFPSKCNSKCCCCGCLDNLRICLLADGSTCPCLPCGTACLLCRRLALPLACFVAPIPRPFPSGEGGDFLFSYARGFAPCIPEDEPERHWFDFKKPILFGVAGERRLQSIKISRKVLGGLGASFKKPPTFLQRLPYTSAGAKNPVQYLQGWWESGIL